MPQFTLPTRKNNPSRKIAYINARLFDAASRMDEKGALLTEGGIIADFGPRLFSDGVPEGIEIVDCGGHLLSPGLIDIQVHFREPGQEHKETLETGSKSASSGGITTVICQPNTKPVIDNVEQLEYLKKRERESAFVNIRVYPAITEAMKGEKVTDMAAMKEAGAVGFTDDGLPVMNARLMREAFIMSKKLGVPIAQHAEDLNLSNGGCINEGEVSRKLGVKGIPNISESVIVARDILILENTGGHYHVLHVSTAEAVDLIRAARKKGLKVTAEAAPHHFTLTDAEVLRSGTNAKMNPPLRSEKDRLAIIEGLKDHTIEAIATDHAPHDLDSKNLPLQNATFGIVGVETLLPLSLGLYHDKTLSLSEVMAKLTFQPADIIGEKRGRIAKNYPADLTLIDINHEWIIEPEKFNSKSKNSPFGGRKVRGRALKTILGGEIVYSFS